MHLNNKLVLFPIFLYFFLFFSVAKASAATYYSSSTGSGTTCSLASPCTLNTGLSKLTAGSTLFLRGGSYNQAVYVSNSGTSTAPITISGYPGETAIIDGNDTIPGGCGSNCWYDVLVSLVGNFITFRDIEVKRSYGMGIMATGNYVKIINVSSHHNWENGILLAGNGQFQTVENSRVFNNCRSNENGSRGRDTYWGSGLSAARHPNGATIRGNTVYNNWGEGLSSYEATNTLIEDNIIYDNWSVNVYLSDTTGTVFQRNVVYRTGAVSGTGGAEAGVALGDEICNPESSDNKILNNIVWGFGRNIEYWGGAACNTHGLLNVVIANNTLVNATDVGDSSKPGGNLYITVSGGKAHANTIIQNNLVYQSQSDSVPICFFGTKTGLTLGHNLWSKSCSSGSGSSDVVGDPLLTRIGTMPDPAWFKLSVNSPALDKAVVISQVTDDYFKTIRGSLPDIGAHEYISGVTPTPTPNTCPLKSYGDTNCLGTIDITDLNYLLSHYGTSDQASDLNSSGKVNLLDLSILIRNFGRTS